MICGNQKPELVVDTHTVRQQVALTKPLYEKRAAVVSQIPNFWPLVFEQAPPDIDEYIQPSDSALLLSSLTSLSVDHFEVGNSDGDPRSVAIKFEFSKNDYFEDEVIEKRFWYRRNKDGWAGLVSEPIDIKWKEGKDLTGGLLSLVKAVWDEEQAAGTNGAKVKGKELTPKQKELKEKIDGIGLGGLSFFAWFGFIGERVSAEESKAATQEEKERRQRRKAGEEVATPTNEAEEDEEDEEDDDLEIFPTGETLALAISDDLWPGAIKYFSKPFFKPRALNFCTDSSIAQAQEEDALSDIDFESDIEELPDASDGGSADESERPSKKRKA